MNPFDKCPKCGSENIKYGAVGNSMCQACGFCSHCEKHLEKKMVLMWTHPPFQIGFE